MGWDLRPTLKCHMRVLNLVLAIKNKDKGLDLRFYRSKGLCFCRSLASRQGVGEVGFERKIRARGGGGMKPDIQLCAFNENGGVDLPDSAVVWSSTLTEARASAQALLKQYPDLVAVWVRRIKAGHFKTLAMIEREVTA